VYYCAKVDFSPGFNWLFAGDVFSDCTFWPLPSKALIRITGTGLSESDIVVIMPLTSTESLPSCVSRVGLPVLISRPSPGMSTCRPTCLSFFNRNFSRQPFQLLLLLASRWCGRLAGLAKPWQFALTAEPLFKVAYPLLRSWHSPAWRVATRIGVAEWLQSEFPIICDRVCLQLADTNTPWEISK
jgi:hypothetical protein